MAQEQNEFWEGLNGKSIEEVHKLIGTGDAGRYEKLAEHWIYYQKYKAYGWRATLALIFSSASILVSIGAIVATISKT